MPIIPKLECRVETFREDGAVFMRIGIHQEEILLSDYAFDTLLTCCMTTKTAPTARLS